MKRFLALLLALCLMAGLVACGGKKPADNAGENPTNPTGGTKNEVPVTPETSPYKGKTLQIYGMGVEDAYTNYDEFGKGNYLWMMKAALEEWAAMNGAKIEYKGAYNQNQVMAAIQSGEQPDIIFQTGNFPTMANVGLTSPLTAEEVKTLADICGTSNYFDLMSYKGQSHGFVFPWCGVQMLYYNKTMFENYGVKTPKEYFAEGAWNWTNFRTCIEELTKDLDNDGVIDTYGINIDSFAGTRVYNSVKEDNEGNLISRADDKITLDYFEMMYDLVTVKKVVMNPGPNRIQSNVTYPMSAMQIGDCEPYNFEHLYQSLPNGDVLEAIPIPVYEADSAEHFTLWTDSCASLAATCDERAAALDLLAYVLKVGLKYISDFSLGAVKCDYVGMQGKCDLAVKWKEAFAKVCADRAKNIKKVDGYDAELVAKINDELNARTPVLARKYPKGVTTVTGYSEMYTLPPASALPVVKAKHQAALDVYNNTYIKK